MLRKRFPDASPVVFTVYDDNDPRSVGVASGCLLKNIPVKAARRTPRSNKRWLAGCCP
jgi:hypothetical protein